MTELELMTAALRAAVDAATCSALRRHGVDPEGADGCRLREWIERAVRVERARNHGGWATLLAHEVAPLNLAPPKAKGAANELAAVADLAVRAAKMGRTIVTGAAHTASPVTSPADGRAEGE